MKTITKKRGLFKTSKSLMITGSYSVALRSFPEDYCVRRRLLRPAIPLIGPERRPTTLTKLSKSRANHPGTVTAHSSIRFSFSRLLADDEERCN